MQHSYAKNIKECKERNILMQKNAKESKTLRSFEENACPTLVLFFQYIYRYIYLYIDNRYTVAVRNGATLWRQRISSDAA